ncbi:MAG: hypothetical protein MJZ66_05100 [Bacteroidales bacterium]|nr:hypothetical protein [Bacteroidales bacterium]
MKTVHYIILAASLAASVAACDTIAEIATEHENWFFNNEEDCECNNKYLHSNSESMPKEGEVTIRVSAQDTRIEIYDGAMDKGKLIKELSAKELRNNVDLPVNQNYTYVAEYLKGDDTIKVAVKSKFECKKNECKGLECYFFYNNIVDLRLRF